MRKRSLLSERPAYIKIYIEIISQYLLSPMEESSIINMAGGNKFDNQSEIGSYYHRRYPVLSWWNGW
jgi:hypothetical protein